MIRIESDNPSIEKNLKTLAKSITDHDGWLDPDLVIRCESGELSVTKEGFRNAKNPLIALPIELLLPAEKMGLTVKNDELVLNIEKDSMTKTQEQLTECIIDIYNQTNKIKDHKNNNHWFKFRSAPEALEDMMAARSVNENHANYLSFTKGKPSDDEINNMLCSTYIKTRTIGHKKPDSENTNEPPTTKIMPIVDFINHDFEGANFNFNAKGYKKDEPDRQFLLVQDHRPILDSGECFAFYNLLDGLDTFINYGFPDSRAPIVRSVPLEIKIPNSGKLIINSYLSPWKKGPLNKNMASLRAFIPQTTKNEKDGDMEVSHLILPVGGKSPHALRRVLRLLLASKASQKLSADQIWGVVLDAERQILDANLGFYKNLLEKYQNKTSDDAVQQSCYQQTAALAQLQITKLYNYELETKEITTADNDSLPATAAG